MPFRGSFLAMLVCTALFLMTTLGAGLFISTISQTQQQALMTFFFLFMPMFLLSGFSFPINSMPAPVQWLTYLNPHSLFHGDHPRYLSPRHRTFNPVAANGSAGRFWRGHFHRQRPAIPKEAGLIAHHSALSTQDSVLSTNPLDIKSSRNYPAQ